MRVLNSQVSKCHNWYLSVAVGSVATRKAPSTVTSGLHLASWLGWWGCCCWKRERALSSGSLWDLEALGAGSAIFILLTWPALCGWALSGFSLPLVWPHWWGWGGRGCASGTRIWTSLTAESMQLWPPEWTNSPFPFISGSIIKHGISS